MTCMPSTRSTTVVRLVVQLRLEILRAVYIMLYIPSTTSAWMDEVSAKLPRYHPVTKPNSLGTEVGAKKCACLLEVVLFACRIYALQDNTT
jgi:hypothetical protein